MTIQTRTEPDGTLVVSCIVEHHVLIILLILETKCLHHVSERDFDVQTSMFTFPKIFTKWNQLNEVPIISDEVLSETDEGIKTMVSPHVRGKAVGKAVFFG